MTDRDPKIIKQLLADLRSYSKERRRTAVTKLGMVGGDEALRALIMTVNNDQEDLIVRGRAAFMLGQLRDPLAVEPLIQALDAPGFQTRFFAAQALGKLGDPRAIKPLVAMLSSDSSKLRQAALEALLRLGYDPSAHSQVESHSSDTSEGGADSQ